MSACVNEFRDPTVNVRGILLDDVAATANGDWFCVQGWDKFSLHVVVPATATAKVTWCGSNEPSQPANSSHGISLAGDITASSMNSFKSPVRWMKARIVEYSGTGGVSAYLEGV